MANDVETNSVQRESDEGMEQRYRRDRRELISFLLKSSLPSKIDLPAGAVSLDDVDLDCISVDYIIHCIREGNCIDISKASTIFYEELSAPPSSHIQEVEVYYLETDPSGSGPPPDRSPPILASIEETPEEDSNENEGLKIDESTRDKDDGEKEEEENGNKQSNEDKDGVESEVKNSASVETSKAFTMDLPAFKTGLTDKDLREAAYEILLSCVSAAGVLMPPVKEKPKSEKKNIFKKLGYKSKHKKDAKERLPGLAGLIEVIRVNLQIDEEDDIRIREAFLHISGQNKLRHKIDTVIIPLELLSSIPPSSFSDKTSYQKWSKRQLNILEEVLLYHSFMNIQVPAYTVTKMKSLVSDFENGFNMPSPTGEAHQMDTVRLIRDLSLFVLDFRSANLQSLDIVLPESIPSNPPPSDTQIVLYNPSDQRTSDPRFHDQRFQDPRFPNPRSTPQHPMYQAPASPFSRSNSSGSSAPQYPDPRFSDPRSSAVRPHEQMYGGYGATPGPQAMPMKPQGSSETCHWADGYYINICLYSQLVKCCFDPHEPHKLVEETEEMFELLKSTWTILGITQTIHDLVYVWALFEQFVQTSDALLLQSAYNQLKRFPSKAKRGNQEKKYFQKLQSTVITFYGPKIMNIIQSVLRPIKKHFESYLLDYHTAFPKGGKGKMEYFLSTVVLISRILADEESNSEDECISKMEEKKLYADLCESFIRSSVNSAYSKRLEAVEKDITSEAPPLTILASQVHDLMKRELENYLFVFKKYNSLSPAISASILHSSYRKQLKPFLDSVSVLTTEVNQVLPAGDDLEQYLLDIINECIKSSDLSSYNLQQKIKPYEVASVSATLLSRWISVQIGKMKEWTERALFIEEWEPVSPNILHANSVVDVFRIINETLDQFFELILPMRINILRSLVTGIDEVFKLYVNKVCDELGTVDALFPPQFPLTRFSKNAYEKYALKSSKTDGSLNNNVNSIDAKLIAKLKSFTPQKLCIRINTIHFLLQQLEETENELREKWISKRPQDENLIKSILYQNSVNNQNIGRKGLHALDEKKNKLKMEKYDEFSAIFDSSKKSMESVIEWLCDYTATKVIMYDLREPFFASLYYGSVNSNRIGAVLPKIDQMLGEICESIIDSLRDKVVIFLLRSSLECFMRVILEGGPSRAFSVLDSRYLDEDLEDLKEFFIANGEGLPKSLVDNIANPTRQILTLFSVDTGTVLESFRQHSHSAISGLNGPAKVRLLYFINDADTIFRVLCHRADREASQYLKKYFQLPKAVE